MGERRQVDRLRLTCAVEATTVEGRPSTSNQQDHEDDQEYGAKAASDIRAAIVEATPTKQKHQNQDKDYQAHRVSPSGGVGKDKGTITETRVTGWNK
jgi:hypothetical protein